MAVPVARRALADGNAYVRYLAIKCLESTDVPLDWETLASDPSDLVRYSRLERNKHFQHSPTEDLELARPERFFALPQAARRAVLRSLVTDPRAVPELVPSVLDQPSSERVVSETELSDLRPPYPRNKNNKRRGGE